MFTASGPPLVVFAGFSPDETDELKIKLARAGLLSKFLYLFFPFGKEQSEYTDKYLKDLFNEILKKIRRYESKKPDNVYGYPGNVLLVHISAKGDHNLYSAGYKIFRISTIQRSSNGGLDLGRIIHKLQDKDFVTVRHIGKNDCRLLPFRNFYIKSRLTIDGKCQSEKCVKIEKETLRPSRLKNNPQKPAYKDKRGINFAISNDRHGNVDLDREEEIKVIVHYLESKYRFGCPIPENHHYHVTKDNGRLKGITFFCTNRDGVFTCQRKHDYLNIGPNDSVRE